MPRISELLASGQGPGRIGGVPVSYQPLRWMRAATQTGKHGAGQATCAMCGTDLPVSLMVPDGGEACADVRWYCRDTVACTKRWTEGQARRAAEDEQGRHEGPDDAHLEHDGPDDAHLEHEGPDDAHLEHEGPDSGHEQRAGPDDEPSGRSVTGAPGTRQR